MKKNFDKKYLIGLIGIIGIFLASTIGVNEAYADDLSHGTQGIKNGFADSCASGGNCYSLGSAGIRFAIVDSNGKIKGGKTLDLWLWGDGIEYYYVNLGSHSGTIYTFRFKKKYMKQELNDSLLISNGNLNYSIFSPLSAYDAATEYKNNITSLMPGILNGMTNNFCWGEEGLDVNKIKSANPKDVNASCVDEKGNVRKGATGYYVSSDAKLNTRAGNVVETIANRIVDDSKGKYKDNTSKTPYYRAIVNALGVDFNNGDYIQMEPLYQWGNLGIGSACGYKYAIFIGTPSEFTYIINALKNKGFAANNLNNPFNTGYGESKYEGSAGSRYACAFNIANASAFYKLATFGVSSVPVNGKTYIPSGLGYSTCGNYEQCFNSLGFKDKKVIDYENDYKAANTILNNYKKTYGVTFIAKSQLSDCASEVINEYKKNKIDKISSSTSSDESTKKYDEAVSAICKKYLGTEDCDWLKWTNNGGNFRNYGINISNLSSCEKPTCNQVAKSKIEKSAGEKNYFEVLHSQWKKIDKNYPKDRGQVVMKMVEDILSSDPKGNITNDNHYWWGGNTLNNAFKFLTIKYYDSNDLKVGKYSDGTMNNIIINNVLGNEAVGDNCNYCETSSCNEVLSKIKSKLSEKSFGKTKLEWMNILFPKYDMLSPEMLKDDTGNIDYSLAACKEAPFCDTRTVKASCITGNNVFTFTDGINDKTYNEGNDFTMSASVFATLTSGSFASNPSCLNAGFAYTSVNGVKLEQKNFQKSKSNEVYNSDSICWESVTFDLPGSVGATKPIEAGTVFRWGGGAETDTSSNVYGNMTITRYCTVNPSSDSVNKLKIGSEWANVTDGKPLIGATVNTDEPDTGVDSSLYNSSAKVNPDITLHYQEAVPEKLQSSYIEKEYKMSVELATVSTNVYPRTTKNGAGLGAVIDPDFIDYTNKVCADGTKTLKQCQEALGQINDHPRRVSLNRSEHASFFNNGGVVETTATYNIVYNENLKWYSDKSNNFKKITETDIKNNGDTVDNAKYVSLGYGLPTSFVTPKLPSGNFFFGYSLSSADKRGKMYVTIKNIGTKVSSTNYHFDNLLKTSKNVLSDDDNGTYSDALVYSCGFNIKNNLYCYECNTDIYKKDCPSGICTPKEDVPNGIDVVFRTVELIDNTDKFKIKAGLEKAFPGRSGSGRNRGLNWTMINGTSLEDEAFAAILDEKVYENSPKYVIDLDSSTIQDIRKKNNKNSYTSLKDYKFANKKYGPGEDNFVDAIVASKINTNCDNLNLKKSCSKSDVVLSLYSEIMTGSAEKYNIDYTYAASDFLSDLITSKKLTGACTKEADSKKRAENFAIYLGC